MNRIIFSAVVIAAALIGPVWAGTVFQYIRPPALNLARAAGQISADGRVVRGQGFTVRHPYLGVYEITFSPGYFPSGCAAMTITAASTNPLIGEVVQRRCGDPFHVILYYPIDGRGDQAFQFTAIEEAM